MKMITNRFKIFFPILYYLGEFSVILLSTHIMLAYTFTKWTFVNDLFIALWFLISIGFKSHVIGRDISKLKLIRSSLKSLFFFSGLSSIFNLLFFGLQFYLSTIILAATIFYFLMLLYRLTVDTILEKYRATGGNILKCLIIGNNSHGSELYNEILKHPELGYRSEGVFSYNKKNKPNTVPYLGSFKELTEFELIKYDKIFFSNKLSVISQEKIIKKADQLNIKVSYIPELAFYDYKNFFISKIATVPYVDIKSFPLDNIYNLATKRLCDIFFSFFVIIFILSWMFPLFGIIIKLTSRGPVLFTQKREGYRGKVFNCLKFRTMVLNPESDTKWADDNDSRLTGFGKFLRMSSLDEFPQFINVFFGDMSVIGPRPHAINLNKEYNNLVLDFNKRHKFKPGITGLAQSMGFNGLISDVNDMKARVKLDIFYFKNWSLLLDIKIAIMTFLILIKFPFKILFK
jgi:putative colanic acid biosynthesis UDP-glucose lipid carrier transferase